MRREKSEYVIGNVDDAVNVLETLGERGDLGVTELARHLGRHKNSAFRLLASLEHRGAVEQSPERRYRLGPKCVLLAFQYLRQNPITRRGTPVLEELARATGESVHVGVLSQLEVVIVAGRRSARPLGSELPLGGRLPWHPTALGKALIGCAPDGEREAYERLVAEGSALAASTPATIVDPDKLLEHLHAVRSQGWATSFEEWEPGLACVAAPVHDAFGRVAGAISVSGPTSRLSRERMENEVVPRLLEQTERLSREFGYQA